MKSTILHYGLAVLAILLGACVGPGERREIPISMPNGEKFTLVAHNQTVPDWMLDRNKLALNYIMKGNTRDKNLSAAIAEAERGCRLFTNTARPSNLVAVISNGIIYAVAGYVGIGIGSRAFTGAVQHQYATYGAWASGTAGLANGTVTLGGQTYTFENCAREIFDRLPSYEVRVLQKSPY